MFSRFSPEKYMGECYWLSTPFFQPPSRLCCITFSYIQLLTKICSMSVVYFCYIFSYCNCRRLVRFFAGCSYCTCVHLELFSDSSLMKRPSSSPILSLWNKLMLFTPQLCSCYLGSYENSLFQWRLCRALLFGFIKAQYPGHPYRCVAGQTCSCWRFSNSSIHTGTGFGAICLDFALTE